MMAPRSLGTAARGAMSGTSSASRMGVICLGRAWSGSRCYSPSTLASTSIHTIRPRIHSAQNTSDSQPLSLPRTSSYPPQCAASLIQYRTMASVADRKPRILILGSGWGGYILSRQLSPSKFDITVLSPRSYFVFTPLLNDTATGELEFAHVVEPVRNRRSAVKFVQGWATKVDLGRGLVTAEGSVTGG